MEAKLTIIVLSLVALITPVEDAKFNKPAA